MEDELWTLWSRVDKQEWFKDYVASIIDKLTWKDLEPYNHTSYIASWVSPIQHMHHDKYFTQ